MMGECGLTRDQFEERFRECRRKLVAAFLIRVRVCASCNVICESDVWSITL